MPKKLITYAIMILLFSISSSLHASGSDDLNTNPQINLIPQFDLSWSLAHHEADDLLFHAKVLILLKNGSYEKATKLLDEELLTKGKNLKSKFERLKARNAYEESLKKDIASAIEAYDNYKKMESQEPK